MKSTVALALAAAVALVARAESATYRFSCEPANDLYRVAQDAGLDVARFDTPEEAVGGAKPGSAVLILAQGYPKETTPVSPSLLEVAKEKGLRVYLEYPSALTGLQLGAPHHDAVERAVVASDFFGESLPRLRLFAINGLTVLPVDVQGAHLVSARVAGFDRAVFGLPEKTYPILFELDENTLVSTTKLSHFITGRYAPKDAWQALWKRVFTWLAPDSQTPRLDWRLTVVPAYGKDEPLSENAEKQTLAKGAEWFFKSKLLPTKERMVTLRESWLRDPVSPRVPTPGPEEPVGDGSEGIMEAPLSIILPDGNQIQSTCLRSDCNTESAMALAFAGAIEGNKQYSRVAENLMDFVYFESDARKGDRGDENHPSFGHIAWGMSTPAWLKANYGDDNARVLLSSLAVAALLEEDRWDEPMMLCILANLRTTGRQGFRHSRVDQEPLTANGWEYYFRGSHVHLAPHFQCYIWACYLWAYDQTGDPLLLDRAKKGLTRTMAAYPDSLNWTNGLAQERARIVLPLAWLVRVENTAENRSMLDKAIDGLLSIQAECGAIREEIGPLANGTYPPSQSNAAYGTTEASLIQENGDPVADLLYTTNFAFIGLHEAAAATGDPRIQTAADKLAEFLCRIQIRSEKHPFLDGGWFRAFDFDRWEFWASNADAGWGAWSIESGWTCGWINAVLAMRQTDTSLWDMAKRCRIGRHHAKWRKRMIPDEVLESLEPMELKHAAVGKPVEATLEPSPVYAAEGIRSLTDGQVGPADHSAGTWLGWEGPDVELTVDLGEPVAIQSVGVRCLESIVVGILLPSEIALAASEDGRRFTPIGGLTNPAATESVKPRVSLQTVAPEKPVTARYLRATVKNGGRLPAWHRSAGRDSWVFIDEVLINPTP